MDDALFTSSRSVMRADRLDAHRACRIVLWSSRAAEPCAVLHLRRGSLACRLARLLVDRPARHLVLAAAVGDRAARGAALEVRRVRLLGAAAGQRAAAQARRRQALLHCRKKSLLLRGELRDAFFDGARLQHAAALQPLPRARKQLNKERVESICSRLSNGITQRERKSRFTSHGDIAVEPRLLHQLCGVHNVLSKGQELCR